jgi:hypothetical protein
MIFQKTAFSVFCVAEMQHVFTTKKDGWRENHQFQKGTSLPSGNSLDFFNSSETNTVSIRRLITT